MIGKQARYYSLITCFFINLDIYMVLDLKSGLKKSSVLNIASSTI